MRLQVLRSKTAAVAVILFFLAIHDPLPADAASHPGRVWNVVSSHQIDDRITQQIQRLALDKHATIRFLDKVPEKQTTNSPGVLIVLDPQIELKVFTQELAKESNTSQIKVTPDLAEEGYILHVNYSSAAKPSRIRIETASAGGLHLALLRLPDLLSTPAAGLEVQMVPRTQSLRLGVDGSEVAIADYPSLSMRGIVEGFYGKPWSHADRLDVLRFQGTHRMNLYVYGPKDDPYHRKLWREPYPAEQLKQIGELAQVAHENFVNFSFAISPGLSMTYSSDDDFKALTKKLEAIRSLGIANFALFLDDVPQDLVHPEDKARFHTLAEAHTQLINRLFSYLKGISPDNNLIVCPTTYTNEWGSQDYIRDLGAGVPSEIPVVWTGTEVIPRTITVEQAEQWGAYLHRKPLIWDNYPTDDGNNAILNLDPLRGREPLLFSAISGLFSNPMNQAHASFIPLQTQSDYLWNPAAYDPKVSEQHAVIAQYGPEAPRALDPILGVFAYNSNDRRLFGSLFSETWAPIDAPKVEERISGLRSMIAALDSSQRYANLFAELKPIPDMLSDQLILLRKSNDFQSLQDGKIQWNRGRDMMDVAKTAAKPVFDGDFAKWESSSPFILNSQSKIVSGKESWKGPSEFSAKIAMSWDKENLYLGVDVTDSDLIHRPSARNEDAVRLVLNTVQPTAAQFGRLPTVFDLFFSPGNFADVRPSLHCEEDMFPPRPRKYDYNREIHAVWKKTATGLSGDVVLPAAFFDRQNFTAGDQFGLSFEVRKVSTPKDSLAEDPIRIVFSSKGASPFPISPESPATLQQIKLSDSPESGGTDRDL